MHDDLNQTNQDLQSLHEELEVLASLLDSSQAQQATIQDEYETNQGLFVQVMDMIGAKSDDWQESNSTGITALAQVKDILATTHDTNMDSMDNNQESL